MPSNFAFRGLKGPKANIISAVQADPAPPAHAKSFITTEIEQTAAEGVIVDCHAHGPTPEDFVLHLHIKKLY